MMRSERNHRSYWAFLGHRLSGIALALFLPLHFFVLAMALEGAAELDRFLVFTDLLVVELAEWGLVVLLAAHLFFGLRLLVLEFFPWPDERDARSSLIYWAAGGAAAIGMMFIVGVV